MKDAQTIDVIDRDQMVPLATTEYRRIGELLRSLDADEWTRQTVCDDWTVQLMVAHLLGAAESAASFRESMRQLWRGSGALRR